MTQCYRACPQCQAVNRVELERLKAARCAKCKTELAYDPPVVELDDAGLQRLVASSPVPLVVDFWAPWCGPCRAFAPTFAAAARQRGDKAIFAKLDTEAHQDAAVQHNVRGIPLYIVFIDGQERARQVGAVNAAKFTTWLQNSGA